MSKDLYYIVQYPDPRGKFQNVGFLDADQPIKHEKLDHISFHKNRSHMVLKGNRSKPKFKIPINEAILDQNEDSFLPIMIETIFINDLDKMFPIITEESNDIETVKWELQDNDKYFTIVTFLTGSNVMNANQIFQKFFDGIFESSSSYMRAQIFTNFDEDDVINPQKFSDPNILFGYSKKRLKEDPNIWRKLKKGEDNYDRIMYRLPNENIFKNFLI